MLRITWGSLLSIVIPGVIAVYALGQTPLAPTILTCLVAHTESLSVVGGFEFLTIALLAGGILEGARTVTLDIVLDRWQRKQGPGENLYNYLTPENLGVFEAAVDNSYRFYTFYGNVDLSLAFALAVPWIWERPQYWGLPLMMLILVASASAVVQHKKFSGFVGGFIEMEKARRLSS
jgi:hypothetical protein